MKNLSIKFLIVVLSGSLLCACKKELNVYPTTSEVDGQVITDQASAFVVLNGVYSRFANVSKDRNNIPTVKWSDVNEAIPSSLTGTLSNSSQPWNPAGFTPTTFGADFQWVYGYGIVNAANGFLKNIASATTISEPVKSEMIAEGKFLRAFGNTQLLLYYGQFYDVSSKYGIIIRNQFVTPGQINLARSTVGETYDAIIRDLDSAIADLPTLNTQIYYANASAAKLLKARVLINRGAAGDYAEVINLTNDLITNGPFQLEGNTKDVFLTKGFSSKEVVLGILPFPNETFRFLNYQRYLQYPITDTMVSLLSNDPRNQWVYKNVISYGRPMHEFTKFYSGNPTTIVKTPLSEYSYAFRLSEAYLLQAEAIALSNGNLSTAKGLLETVLGHAGVTDFSGIDNISSASDLQIAIVKEELKNFVGENGADWFALRRLPLNVIKTIQPLLTSKDRFILPIPAAEISQNTNMIQNP